MGVRAASKCFECYPRFFSAYASQSVGAFTLKCMKVAPLNQMAERNIDGLLNYLDSTWLPEEPEVKDNILVQVMPVV